MFVVIVPFLNNYLLKNNIWTFTKPSLMFFMFEKLYMNVQYNSENIFLTTR